MTKAKSRTNGRYSHGHFTCEANQQRAEMRAFLKEVREALAGI